METNQFEVIDAQDQTSRMAQMTPEEGEEYGKWLDEFMAEVVSDLREQISKI